MNFDVSTLSQLVGNLGFPIVMCGYVMVKLNKTVEKNTEATNNLVLLVTQLVGKMKDDDK